MQNFYAILYKKVKVIKKGFYGKLTISDLALSVWVLLGSSGLLGSLLCLVSSIPLLSHLIFPVRLSCDFIDTIFDDS